MMMEQNKRLTELERRLSRATAEIESVTIALAKFRDERMHDLVSKFDNGPTVIVR